MNDIKKILAMLAVAIGLPWLGEVAPPALAQTSSLKISETTKTYYIRGKTAADFAESMGRKGPYSRQHRRRAWATATRDLTYQLYYKKSKKQCRIKAIRAKLKITYIMPKLASTRGVSKRERNKWKKMYALLNKHERKHGQYYQQFARKAYNSVRKLRPARTCRQLERNADRLINKLGEEDKRRNLAFDERDRSNYRSMERLYGGV